MKNLILILIVLLTLKGIAQKTRLDTIKSYSNQTSRMKSNVIPDSVFQMINLKTLSITGTDCDYVEFDDNGKNITKCWMLKEIPEKICNLIKLEYLQLNVNAIQKIPKEIRELNNLKVLDLTDNPSLYQIDNIILLENLEELYLDGCNLTKLPENLAKLNKLKRIGLVGNNFDKQEIERIKKELHKCEIILE